jgi:sigma-B regulation protein RsbU (phosphoserine phosphatase)
VGDVSDKGIPAALFMAVTKTLLKGTAEPYLKPSEILQRVNIELCHDNESNMFVTVFCGILNFKSGELFYSNAGHNPPLLVRASQDPEWLELPQGFFLGVFEESQYHTEKVELRSGDLLLVYTDGVTEAINESKELYSDHRLLETIRTYPDNSPEELVNKVVCTVKSFSKEVSQADDITVLALRFKGIKNDSPYPGFFQYA